MNRQAEATAPAPQAQTVAPIRMSIEVAHSAEAAFRFFVERFSQWWPVARHSVSAMRSDRNPVSITMEGRQGGRVYETDDTGARTHWGTIHTFEAGRRIVMSWHPGSDPAEATEVEFRFVATGPSVCRVELEHRHWHRLRGNVPERRSSYENGWTFVIGVLEDAYCSA